MKKELKRKMEMKMKMEMEMEMEMEMKMQVKIRKPFSVIWLVLRFSTSHLRIVARRAWKNARISDCHAIRGKLS